MTNTKPATDHKRKPRKLYITDVLIGAVVLGIVGYLAIGNRGSNSDCQATGAEQRVVLKADTFAKASMDFKRCDRLIVENRDNQAYDLNFGDHDNHIQYPGYEATTLLPNEDLTVRLSKTGLYEFHDHFRDNAVLRITVE
jgi:hypothetical protein